jgi:autotransporter strand-loop-strand O-heptosyltransferase
MKKVLKKIYDNVKPLYLPFQEPQNRFMFHFVEGAFLEVLGPEERQYKVLFTDQKTNEIVHESIISNNMWTRTNRQYFTDWLIQVFDLETNDLVFEHKYDVVGKKVYIHMDSTAVGDTLAWFPFIDEFRKKYNCEMVASTFHNEWFIKTYPEIKFVKPGTQVNDLYAMYNVGWFYDENHKVNLDRNVTEFKNIPLGKASSDILGLEYIETKPKVFFNKKTRPVKEKYVVIAPHASAHAKYWNYPGGWQRVIDWLKEKGYKTLMITSEPLGDGWHDSKLGGTLKNVINKTGKLPLEDRMSDISHAEAFIGVGSGLSWVSWAVGQKTILISGFSEPYSEFEDCERIYTPTGLCSGCFNREWLNPGDWEWCPEHKDTPRHFECTKSITPEMVIKSLEKVLNIY